MNLTQAGLSTSFSLDAVNRQLSNNATSNVSFDPTSKARVSAHEIDRQSEDNATWYFEYRALLNSKLTTLITSLTSAYTTDLDASMGQKMATWGDKNAMQGLSGSLAPGASAAAGDRPLVDPGAARTTVAYLSKFGLVGTAGAVNLLTPVNGSAATNVNWGGGDGTVPTFTASDPTVTLSLNFATGASATTASPSVTGTTTFMSGGSADFVLDNLHVNMDPYNFSPDTTGVAPRGMGVGNANYNYYDNTKSSNLSSYDRKPDDTTDPVVAERGIGNNLEFTLYKFFERPENLDLIRFGFFKDVYVVGTSSLPTGSQIQGSLSMDWDQAGGIIRIKQERYAAFFHS